MEQLPRTTCIESDIGSLFIRIHALCRAEKEILENDSFRSDPQETVVSALLNAYVFFLKHMVIPDDLVKSLSINAGISNTMKTE